jgi:hypothetical protein
VARFIDALSGGPSRPGDGLRLHASARAENGAPFAFQGSPLSASLSVGLIALELTSKEVGRVMNNKIILAGAVLVAVFLIGFVPMYVKANRLDAELRSARTESAGAELRDWIALAYLQTNQKNYGLAADTTSRFFNRARELANLTQEAGRRKALDDLLTYRDKVTSELAKGDAAALADLQDLFVKTREATRNSTDQ